jgi:hypothetical protein
MNSIPTAGCQSELRILGMTIRVYVLDDGRRVVDADDAHAFFELLMQSGYGLEIARFIKSKQ